MNQFSIGQIVNIVSNPSIKGVITAFKNLGNQIQYNVFIEGAVQNYFETQLQLVIESDSFRNLSLTEFNNLITSIQIKKPGINNLYSLNSARIDFIPYQFRPVLKFIKADRPRILIADGVGVGKTIEAGLILRELQARRTIKSILIICPRPLVTERKWESEMKRFDEKFVHLDGESLRYCINEMDLDGEWPDQYCRAIMPYSLFDEVLLRGTEKGERRKRKVGLLDLDPPPRFDLVIVDEAHHVRNADSIRHQVVSYFCDHAEAVVFLTATPIQMGNKDLFVLLKLLRPDLILDTDSFQHLTSPNTFINNAVKVLRGLPDDWKTTAKQNIQDAADTSWGKSMFKTNPLYISIVEDLNKEKVSDEERIALINKIENLHTLSGIINRTRRRDIGNFTIRKPETVYVPFTTRQKRLHDAILAIQEEIFSSVMSIVNVKFLLTTIRRQTASCIYGLTPFLRAILTRHLDVLEESEMDETDNFDGINNELSGFLNRIERILHESANLDDEDPKLEALLKIIAHKQMMKNNRVMLFSSFRHTLAYLYNKLQLNGTRVGMIHGGIDDEERRELRQRFQMDATEKNSIDVLLFSEVGCEGLDYQFCDCLVNYDLPWNPMKIEQRIGRIDRNGQKSESVLIYNLITPDTIDADIYDRCMLRIGVFSQSIGDCEEILGEITSEILDVCNNYTLKPEEQRIKIQQIADNKIRLLQEQELLEKKQVELFGINMPEKLMQKEIDEATSYWLEQEAIQSLIDAYLRKLSGKDIDNILGNNKLKTLRLSQELRKNLLNDYLKLPQQKNSVYKEWDNWLRGSDTHLQITFDSETAKDNTNITLVTAIHPLALQAANATEFTDTLFLSFTIESKELPKGNFEFAIYQWKYLGLKETTELKVVSPNNLIDNNLLSLFKLAKDNEVEKRTENEDFSEIEIEKEHYQLWANAKQKHIVQTQQLINFKKESLLSSHQARIALINEQLNKASNDKIIKMRNSQIANAEADFIYRNQQLQSAFTKADIIASPIVFGILKIN